MKDKKNIKKMIESLESSIKRDPQNDKLLLSLAEGYFQLEIFDSERLDIYEMVSERFPEASNIKQALSIGYLLQQIQEFIEDIVDLNNVDTLTLDKNISKLQSLLEKYPNSPDIAKTLGDVCLLHGKIKEGIAAYEKSISLGYSKVENFISVFELSYYYHPFLPTDLIYFAEIHRKVGKSDKAIDLYRTILNAGYLDSIVAGKLISLIGNKISAAPKTEDLNPYYIELSQLYLNLGETTEALYIAQKINLYTLKDYTFIKKLVRKLINMEDYRQAFDYLSKIPLDEEAKQMINEITMLLEKRGELDTAVYLLKFINENDIAIAEANVEYEKEIEINTELGLGDLNYKNKKFEQALEKYIIVLNMGFSDIDSILPKIDRILKKLESPPLISLLALGKFFAGRNDFYRALNYFDLILKYYPEDDESKKELRRIYNTLLEENPDLAELRIKSFDLYLAENNFEKSIEEYSSATNYPEVNLRANKKLAETFLKMGNLQMAFEKYKYNPLLETEDLNLLYDMMGKFEENGKIQESLDVAKMIYDSRPNYKNISNELSRLQKRLRETSESIFIDPKMVELIGEQAIGKYRHIDKIGSGGMGVVHKVYDLKNSCVVAMKILREGLASNSKAIDRFFREARIAATLNHRNIVNIYDYTISNVHGQSYIAMEYVDGPSLREIIEKRFKDTNEIKIKDITETLFYMSQLCDALDATHRKGIIHRDIKPDNIMITSEKVVKITDFGIVHIEEATFTPTGALIGTPRYMSPEQVQGGRIDGRSDVYSVGIINYEMLIGTPPFISGDIAYQQVNVIPTRLREINKIIPQDVDDIVIKTLEKIPANRFQTALELKKSIDNALKNLGGYKSEKTTHSGLRSLDPDMDF